MNLKEKRKELFQESLKHVKKLKHEEFTCPICGGVASVIQSGDEIEAECHACGIKAWKK